jgi:hypothetical protein
MRLPPAHVAAIAMAAFGLALVVAAFVGASFGVVRLLVGLALIVIAMVTSGLQLLATGGGASDEEA